MDLVAEVEGDSDKVFQVSGAYRLRASWADHRTGTYKSGECAVLFRLRVHASLTRLTGGRIFMGGERVRIDMEEPQTMSLGKAPSDVHAHP